MNKEWKSHTIVKYVGDWIAKGRPQEKYIGFVLNAPKDIPEPQVNYPFIHPMCRYPYIGYVPRHLKN